MGVNNNDKNLDRRNFIIRSVKAGAAVAAAGIGSAMLYDKDGPASGDGKNLVTLPDFSVPQKDGKTISIVKGSDRIKTVNKAIDLLGGIERFVQKGDIVVIKPNVAFASPAFLGATAHPQLIAEVVKLCYSRGGAKQVIVTDNPINDPASCFAISGIGKAATQAGAKVLLPDDKLFENATVKGGKLIKNWPIFYGPLQKANKLIGISPVKDHHRSGASLSMKNFYGLMGGRRNIFHQDIHTIITEIAMLFKPTLVILDGTNSMMHNGPTGGSVSDLRDTNTLIASCDMVAADAFGCGLLDMNISDLPYIRMAEEAGCGISNYESLKPIMANFS